VREKQLHLGNSGIKKERRSREVRGGGEEGGAAIVFVKVGREKKRVLAWVFWGDGFQKKRDYNLLFARTRQEGITSTRGKNSFITRKCHSLQSRGIKKKESHGRKGRGENWQLTLRNLSSRMPKNFLHGKGDPTKSIKVGGGGYRNSNKGEQRLKGPGGGKTKERSYEKKKANGNKAGSKGGDRVGKRWGEKRKRQSQTNQKNQDKPPF